MLPQIAREKGVKFRRQKIDPGENFEEVYKEWKSGDITAVKAMNLLDLKPNTFYRRVNEYELKK
ncbi:MAG: hypothetical protein ACRCX2_31485 [Paraclostridium sp.]